MKLSASQIQLWTECKRKWAFRYIEQRPVPTHPSAALGTEVHRLLGQYLKGEGLPKDSRAGRIAEALIPMLPPPGENVQIEKSFEFPSPSGICTYRGFIDLLAYDTDVLRDPSIRGGMPLIGDFKTKSNLSYALTLKGLAADIQAQLYAMAMLHQLGVDEVALVWFYVQTRETHRTRRLYLTADRDSVQAPFERIEGLAQEILAARECKTANELPPNTLACEAYGGCPHRHVCNLSPVAFADGWNQGVKEKSMSTTNNFLAQLRKNAGAEEQMVLPAINPPESALPPAPAVNVAAVVAAEKPAPAAKATNKTTAKGHTDVVALAALLKANGIKRILFDEMSIVEIELA